MLGSHREEIFRGSFAEVRALEVGLRAKGELALWESACMELEVWGSLSELKSAWNRQKTTYVGRSRREEAENLAKILPQGPLGKLVQYFGFSFEICQKPLKY